MSGRPADEGAGAGLLEELPGDLMIWVLIVSELLAFGAGLLAFLAVRAGQVELFAESQDHLNRVAGAVNTIVLVSSGFMAAMAARAAAGDEAEAGGRGASRRASRLWLAGAMLLGGLFMAIKSMEYAAKARAGIGIDTNDFFTFYYLLTGFHAAHVLAGLVIFALLLWRPQRQLVEAGAQFWHMVDLVWLLLFPIIYLLR